MDGLPAAWLDVVRAALAEDLGEGGDVTSRAVVPEKARIVGRARFREPGVVCGLDLFAAVFGELDQAVVVTLQAADGDAVEAGASVATVEGPARAVLSGERTALNLLSHLSGVATRTAAFVAAVAGTGAEVFDTRKTTPGLRELEKHAVRVGGGRNHRTGLSDAVLIKDNHLELAGGVESAVRHARDAYGDRYVIEVEVESAVDAALAADAGADIVMLDNMSLEEMREAVAAVAGRATLEASGGITLETARAVAETGVARIAVGALTRGPGIDVAVDLR